MGAANNATVLPNGSTLAMNGSGSPLDSRNHSLVSFQGFRTEDGTGGADGALVNIQSPIDLVTSAAQKITVPAGATRVRLWATGKARIGLSTGIMTYIQSTSLPSGPSTPADGDGSTIGSGSGWFPIPKVFNKDGDQVMPPLELSCAGMPYFYIGATNPCSVFFLFDVNSAL